MMVLKSSFRGPSPPTRGSPLDEVNRRLDRGSIPAHAGKPFPFRPFFDFLLVHPRPRGEAGIVRIHTSHSEGPSPPTRGSPGAPGRGPEPHGSIPAHAGKPPTSRSRASPSGVHPRPRGEACWRRVSVASSSGPSPPTRGSRPDPAMATTIHRSIPAHAGKPDTEGPGNGGQGVHPRPRGEAVGPRLCVSHSSGPSPPTRGSHPGADGGELGLGSIPAHAGKPSSPRGSSQGKGVHPRPRGEALQEPSVVGALRGPSPPTRGSRTPRPCRSGPRGSIPAHAGKPARSRRARRTRRVHPRPRGEAAPIPSPGQDLPGPSPPTRGSRRGRPPGGRRPGSIPAHAGKPGGGVAAAGSRPVHPRPRGEAAFTTAFG